MSLNAGSRLGPYEILAPIGAGGMGEVYRGRDTRLDRIVAIKVLLPEVAANPERRERFEREARAVSSLNHEHICTLYDVGHQDGIDYIVMEYLEGETIAQRLERGPLPLAEALRYAVEISDALDKAHRHGVTHRDLKPGNIFLTKSGAKLLDFGLAKLRDKNPVSVASAPTRSALTAEGTILGTIQYMAPEQLEGEEADARTDLFAFGAMLYEMITGRKAFEGKSQVSVMAAILEHEPPAMSTLQKMTPPALDRVVKKCLAKDPDKRWQTAGDLTDELKWIVEGGSSTTAQAPVVIERKRRERFAWALTAISILLAAATVFYFVTRSVEAPEMRVEINTPPTPNLASMAISPDGGQVVFLATVENKTQLWVRSLDSVTALPLAGTEGAFNPFWSPDSRSIGFFADGKLKRIDIAGGASVTLATAGAGRGGAWNRDGVIVFSPGSLRSVSSFSGRRRIRTRDET